MINMQGELDVTNATSELDLSKIVSGIRALDDKAFDLVRKVVAMERKSRSFDVEKEMAKWAVDAEGNEKAVKK